MATTPEQRAAVKEVKDWYQENEKRLGLRTGTTRNFSHIRFRREQAIKGIPLHPIDNLPDRILNFR